MCTPTQVPEADLAKRVPDRLNALTDLSFKSRDNNRGLSLMRLRAFGSSCWNDSESGDINDEVLYVPGRQNHLSRGR